MERTAPTADVLVIGAGQAGLAAAARLSSAGYRPVSLFGARNDATDRPAPSAGAVGSGTAEPSFAVVDANDAAGGAWQHRWESLTMGTVNGIFALPGMPVPASSPDEPSRIAVPAYFRDFERELGVPIGRPVRVLAVERVDTAADGLLRVRTDRGAAVVRAVINATGTWNAPVVPVVPGQDLFRGTVLHARDYVSATAFAGRRVGIVGGGITAVQLLDEVSRVATTRWYTRRPPVFREGPFLPEVAGVDVTRRVAADVEAGRPSRSIVSYTGLLWSDAARSAQARGALDRRPLFTSFTPTGVVEQDGSSTSLDVVIWATGFRPDLAHLAPLALRSDEGGIPVVGTRVAAEPRIHLVGFGPSQSTVGANRAGTAAVRELTRMLDGRASADEARQPRSAGETRQPPNASGATATGGRQQRAGAPGDGIAGG
ncbi:NAD(P)-binding domain-containing protein [Mycetocola reblochoni]|uniref:Oxidoreductase n=2 Tax=Mycetocola reblochoni TaxID=331618 RepID=A0A1R4JNR9_9MICO|nr:NAD(P)-binding domain-containing protein [Mycetocola reblochoni]RLP68621.1 pyridine nucleotide-disulfide oxidoreductase [Mycetocola reblochoni]SJN33612.1 oxidoreductase [Mycetocola reblochoni REB411]